MDTTESHTDPTPARPAARPGDVLASDAEREAVARIIQQAAGDGRLTPAETDDRLATLYNSRYRGEFATLTRDLPQPEPDTGQATRAGGDRSWLYPGFVLHAVIVLVIAIALVTRWAVSPVLFFWPAWPLLWLAVSLLIHARIRRSGRLRAWS